MLLESQNTVFSYMVKKIFGGGKILHTGLDMEQAVIFD